MYTLGEKKEEKKNDEKPHCENNSFPRFIYLFRKTKMRSFFLLTSSMNARFYLFNLQLRFI